MTTTRGRLYNFKQAAVVLGLTRQTVGELVKRIGMETQTMDLPGRARYLTTEQVDSLANQLGIEVNQPIDIN